MQVQEFIADALSRPRDAIFHTLSRSIAAAFPDRFVLETEDPHFDVVGFAREGRCRISPRADIHNQWSTHYWHCAQRSFTLPKNAWLEIEWEGGRYEIVRIEVEGSCGRGLRSYLIAGNAEEARAFFVAVCAWSSEVRCEILVYDGTHWSKDPDLFREIRCATLEDLVLPGDAKREILHDFQQFFGSEETYRRYGIPWKRGVLFLGPPGNGKTHMVKALVNELGKPCLYVRSFRSRFMPEHMSMDRVFEKTREASPCLLVLEDLDSMVDEENRSAFLNELDGFRENRGLLTVATCNHPERLDPAILDRPSRFDRKYAFGLPGPEERRRYLDLWNARIEPDLRLTKAGLDRAAGATDGFSYAYLKELLVSAMMDWVASPGTRAMDEVALRQTELLRDQMRAGVDILGLAEKAPEKERAPGRQFRRSRR